MKQTDIEPSILKWILEDCCLLTDDSTGSAIQSRAAARLMGSLNGEGLQVTNEDTEDEFCITFSANAYQDAVRCLDAKGFSCFVTVELVSKGVGPARTGGEIADIIDPDRFKMDDLEDNEKGDDEG